MSTANYEKAVSPFKKAGILPKWLLPIAPVGAVIAKTANLTADVLGKAPGRFNEARGTWSGLFGGIIRDGVKKAEYEEFRDWPTSSVGILGRAFPGIDSDAASDKARRLVERVLDEVFGHGSPIAERLRGKGPRRLYAFQCAVDREDSWVKTRHFTYTLPGDDEQHKVDILGYGSQYLIAGLHNNGKDHYEWSESFPLNANVPQIDNADMERFIDALQDTIEKAGGEIIRSSGGGAFGEDADVRKLDPVMDVEDVFAGLAKLPNNEDNFPHRDDLVAALSAVRMALGKKSFDKKIEDRIFEWATQDESWCDADYFDKVWVSLDKVRSSRDSLDRLFRRNKIQSHVGSVFDKAGAAPSKEITASKQAKKETRSDILDEVAKRYIFGRMNTRDGNAEYTMRDRWDVEHEWKSIPWWKYELAESNHAVLNVLHDEAGYNTGKVGYANFLRDLFTVHPEVFYSGETKHPAFEKGEIFEDVQPDGVIKREVNMRYMSAAIRHARKPPKDAKRAQADVTHILEFVNLLFGKDMAAYELDTLAYMAQTGDRPGHLLFMVGDSGVGKSLWMNLQMTLFDGAGPEQSGIIDGTKLQNESARRFILARVEGCRVVSIRELPEGNQAAQMVAVTAQLKQMVDPGPEGDWLMVEEKGVNARPVRNHSRVIISSNYANAIHVDAEDRRIFYVKTQIPYDDKPDEEFYGEIVDIIQNPERLAAVWRYLLSRDIGTYSRYTAPLVSVEKRERVVAEIKNPAVRHAKAAMILLTASRDRVVFDAAEFAEIMTDMSEYEFVNSGGSIDNRNEYTTKDKNGRPDVLFLQAMKSLRKKEAMRLDREIRTAKQRVPAIYILADNGALYEDFMEMGRDEIIDFMENERGRRLSLHPFKLYRKPSN